MASTAVNAAEAMLDVYRSGISPAYREASVNDRPRALRWSFAQKFTLPAAQLAAGKLTLLAVLPAGSYIWGWRSTPSDLDTDGTPAIVYDIVTTDEDDNVKVTLVSGSTNGQAAAGSDSLAAGAYGRYVGNQRLVFKIATAADVAAAGTLKCAWELTVGVITRGEKGAYMYDVEA